MAGNGSGRSGSSRGMGGRTAAPARALNQKMIEQGIRTTYKAQGDLINDRFGPRVGPRGRQAKRDRMSARLDARRDTLFAARRQMERDATARTLRDVRRASPATARAIAAVRREARRKAGA